MKEEMKKVRLEDPQLPSALKEARRNHGGMTVPEDFFAQFEQKVNAMIDAEISSQKSSELPSLQPQIVHKDRSRVWISVAASVVIAVAIGLAWQFVDFSNNETQEIQPVSLFAELENEAVNDGQAIELPEEVSDEMMASASDYEIFDIYCDI